MTRVLANDEFGILARELREDLNLSKFLHENPLNTQYQIFGTTRGLELPAKALASLAEEFHDDFVDILGIDGRRVDEALALEVDVRNLGEVGNAAFHIQNLPNVFASDLVVAFGRSRSWYAIFDAELSLGVLVVKRKEDIQRAVTAYGTHDIVLTKLEGFKSSVEEEVEPHLPNAKEIADSLYKNWPN